jgi:hypothetical protein
MKFTTCLVPTSSRRPIRRPLPRKTCTFPDRLPVSTIPHTTRNLRVISSQRPVSQRKEGPCTSRIGTNVKTLNELIPDQNKYRERDLLNGRTVCIVPSRTRMSTPFAITFDWTEVSYFDYYCPERAGIGRVVWILVRRYREASTAGVAWADTWRGPESQLGNGSDISRSGYSTS